MAKTEQVKNMKAFVNGQWVTSDKEFSVLNPATGEMIAKVPSCDTEILGEAIGAASESFDSGVWTGLGTSERASILLKVADLLESRSTEVARIESQNTGKSIKQTMNYDLPYTIDNIRFIAGASRILEGKAMAEYSSEGTSAVRREPIGVVGVITPWNYPLMMAIWRALPAIAVGNSVVLKPASYTPISSLLLAEMFEKAGLPKGVLNVVTGSGGSIGEAIARDKRVDMIAFTGSEEVGRRLSELGSSTLKKVSLELGGKAPFIVFDDANVEAAVNGAIVGGLVNNGEDCANSTRYYIHEKVLDKFKNSLISGLKKVKVGDPMVSDTDMGPLISTSHRDRVMGYIHKGLDEGGKLEFGGNIPTVKGGENGFFLNPSVIYTENENSAIVKEEIFGPVFTVLPFSDYDDVIQRSNNVIYGLGSSIWTKDVTRAMRATKDLRFGTVWVNEHVVVPSEMPWAGYKRSGHGASLSPYSLEEFTYIKHVYFDLTGKERKSWYWQIYGEH